MNWKNWFSGLVWAILAGAGTGISFVLADPEHFNFTTGWKSLLGVSGAFGLLAAASYLKDSRPTAGASDLGSIPSFPGRSSTKIGPPAAAILLAIGLAATLPACASSQNPPPTKVAQIADVGAKVEASAGQLLKTATSLQAAGVITRAQLDIVAIAVDKVGRIGQDLKTALDDYNALKAAGKDPSAASAAVQKAIGDVVSALADVGKSIPNGTVQAIDQAVTAVFGVIAEVKLAAGL